MWLLLLLVMLMVIVHKVLALALAMTAPEWRLGATGLLVAAASLDQCLINGRKTVPIAPNTHLSVILGGNCCCC